MATFGERELSVQDGSKLELWDFTVYGTHYRYTTNNSSYVFDAQTYTATPLSHTEFEETDKIERNNLTMYCPLDFPILDFYETSPPSDVIRLAIYEVHRGVEDASLAWVGRILNGKRTSTGGELYGENIMTSLKRQGPRRTYAVPCPHVLYGAACKANELDFVVAAPVDAVSGLVVQSASFAVLGDDRLAGGVLEWEPTPGKVERRSIKAHVGDTVIMLNRIPGLALGAIVKVLPGCKHTLQDCDEYFGNSLNHGGFPFTQEQNPMGSNPVF